MEDAQNIPRDDLVELPLFPLNNVVLFSGMHLPLHIFEERYKAMIGECNRRGAPFGVLLVKDGQEVGDPAEPFSIGTTARITNVQELQEGRLNIITVGERRFQVVEIVQRVPHLVGLVKYLEEDEEEVSESLVESIQKEFTVFLARQATIAGGWNSKVSVTDQPSPLFSEVMSSLSSSVDLPKELRQRLLETPAVAQRLEQLLPILQRGNQIMLEHVEKSNPFQGYRLN